MRFSDKLAAFDAQRQYAIDAKDVAWKIAPEHQHAKGYEDLSALYLERMQEP